MRIKVFLLMLVMLAPASLQAQTDSGKHFYGGLGLSKYLLDDDRGPNIDDPGVGSVALGYQFNNKWATDLTLGTDLSGDTSINSALLNVYRFFGVKPWRPYISAGIGSFSIDDVSEDPTEEIQAGFGLSGMVSDKLELRVGYQHFYDVGAESNNDDAVGVFLNWHFKKPRAVAVVQPEPESVPVQKEVIDTFELLVQFDFDKSNIKSVFESQFQEIARVLKENPDITMTIEGHTCWIGPEEYNQALSERRANAVKDEFVNQYGVSAGRINTVGFGETRPFADNSTLEGRKKNRRAIAVILRPRMVTE